MKHFLKKIIIVFFVLFSFAPAIQAETIEMNGQKLIPSVEVSLSPQIGSFVEGSTFQVPILFNTNKQSVNGIEVHISYDKNKLSIIQPAGGTSAIGVWVEPPSYDNTRGVASYVGVVPAGIVTDSGLVGMITFKALSPGKATVSIDPKTKILISDGFGTSANVATTKSVYTILPKAPAGARVFSETHPFETRWYNNNSPVISWDKEQGVEGFSFVLDNKPTTIPKSAVMTEETTKGFEAQGDGIWYFHIKAYKNGVWGNTTHFLVRIDTTPPAEFTPENNYLLASVAVVKRTLVSFFTTDNLSGVDHYEVGVIDKSQSTTVSPSFVEAESPFQVPVTKSNSMEVIVRAIDKAGNTRDESLAVSAPFVITEYIREYAVYILLTIILLGLVMLVIHYMVGHHIIRYLKRLRLIIKKEEEVEKLIEIRQDEQELRQIENIEMLKTPDTPATVEKPEVHKSEEDTHNNLPMCQ